MGAGFYELGNYLDCIFESQNRRYRAVCRRRALRTAIGGLLDPKHYRLKLMDNGQEVERLWYDHFHDMPLPAEGSRLEIVSGCFASGPVRADFPVTKVQNKKGIRMPIVEVDWNQRRVLD